MNFWKRNFHQNLFFHKSISLQNLMRCKFFSRNPLRSKTFDSRFVELWKNGSKCDAFEILDSKNDALYKKWFKNWFSKTLIQKSENFFIKKKKQTFYGTTFPRMRKKNNFDVFMVYTDQINAFLRESFPTSFDFLKTVFSSKSNALLKSWFKFSCYVDIQVTLWHEVIFFKVWGVVKKLIQNLIFLKVFDSNHVFFQKHRSQKQAF